MKVMSEHSQDRPTRPNGFTLLEMLTVVVIVGLLLAIGVPSILQMQKHAIEKASRVVINTLDGACRYYAGDNRNHVPPSNWTPWGGFQTGTGRYCLVQALTGYAPAAQDGVDGWGYRDAEGKKHGAYVDVDKMRITSVNATQAVFRDGFENEIWYYSSERDTGTPPGPQWFQFRTGIINTMPTGGPFDSAHNDAAQLDPNAYVTNIAGQNPQYLTIDILICSRGADAIWGSRDHADGVRKLYKDYRNIDDITNFFKE